MKEVKFEELLGQKANLYYCNDLNRFQLGSVLFEVIEDENDGYRSMMDKVLIVDEDAKPNQLLSPVIIAQAIRHKNDYNDIEGFSLVDAVDSHVWLTFGTDNVDDYYPCFRFNFYPKPPADSVTVETAKGIIGKLLS